MRSWHMAALPSSLYKTFSALETEEWVLGKIHTFYLYIICNERTSLIIGIPPDWGWNKCKRAVPAYTNFYSTGRRSHLPNKIPVGHHTNAVWKYRPSSNCFLKTKLSSDRGMFWHIKKLSRSSSPTLTCKNSKINHKLFAWKSVLVRPSFNLIVCIQRERNAMPCEACQSH